MVDLRATKIALFLSISLCLPVAASAQTKSQSRDETKAELSTGLPAPAATVDAIMAQAVRNIAVRYNLNDGQMEKTHQLMKREVEAFLRDHEEEVWPVIRDLIHSQFRDPANEEDRKRLGKAAGPLAKAAKEAIFRANEEWRLYLTPGQREVHDFDLSEMEKTFTSMDENLNSWAAGTKTNKSIFPDPQIANAGPQRPAKPDGHKLPRPEIVYGFKPDHIFDTIVEEFIKEYELEKGQITSARSILEEFKAKANDFKASKKDELAKIYAELTAAHERRDSKAKQQLDADRKKLFEPVMELTEQMGERLRNLLTTAQLQRHAEKSDRSSAKGKTRTAGEKNLRPRKSASVADSAEGDAEREGDDD